LKINAELSARLRLQQSSHLPSMNSKLGQNLNFLCALLLKPYQHSQFFVIPKSIPNYNKMATESPSAKK